MSNLALNLPSDNHRAGIQLSNPFSVVIPSCLSVVRAAQDVSINEKKVEYFAEQMPSKYEIAWKFSGKYHYTGDEFTTLRYVLCIGAINFGSGYAADLIRSVPGSTYYTVASHLKNAVLRDPSVLRTSRLQKITQDEVREIFGQEHNNNPNASNLMLEFATSLNELGHWLESQYDDDLSRLTQDARSAERMLRSILLMKRFCDMSYYDKRPVYFFKRAQLLVADLARIGREFGWWKTTGLINLTIFADNAVAHVMRSLGLLDYSDTLTRRIDRGDYLERGEPCENEIRAASIIVGEMLRKQLVDRRNWPTILEIDHYLWDISHDSGYQDNLSRRHKCRTIAY